MQINLRDINRTPLFTIQVDEHAPPMTASPQNPSDHSPNRHAPISLNWDDALDDQNTLKKCPACGCRDLFSRRDFPQRLGLIIVIIAAALALTLFATRQAIAAFIVLGATVVIDAAVLMTVRRCVVCYRCRTEFRNTPITPHHQPHDLATAEKYRHP